MYKNINDLIWVILIQIDLNLLAPVHETFLLLPK